MRFRLALLLVSVAGSASSAAHAWVELAPASEVRDSYKILARYATASGESCPNIVLDRKSHRMMRRTPTGSFAALICEMVVPSSVRSATIFGSPLPLPKWSKAANPRVVVVGDTGCRIKKGSDDPTQITGTATWNMQKCDSPKDWPFEEVAGNAAATDPELVIHVGDYLYREQNCAGIKDCPGGPAGDNFAAWEADFFEPGKKLLVAAPWIFIRGNHENCGRAGDGWFSLLDPRPFSRCVDFTDPYRVQAGKLPLVILDDSTATDVACRPKDAACATRFSLEVEHYTKQFCQISGWNLQDAWLLMHRPVWSVKKGGDGVQVLNAVIETAWDQARPQGVDLLLAGHTHVFELIGFRPESGHATQLVIGNSGTKLAPKMIYDAKARDVTRASINNFRDIQDFGFTTLTYRAGTWRADAHDRAGTIQFTCALPLTGGRCGE